MAADLEAELSARAFYQEGGEYWLSCKVYPSRDLFEAVLQLS